MTTLTKGNVGIDAHKCSVWNFTQNCVHEATMLTNQSNTSDKQRQP